MADELKVLFVEDDADVRFGGVQALSLAGIEVQAFETAEAALPHLHPYYPGVLVTDVKMRGMSGLELLGRAREIDPSLPIILVTGHGDVAMAVGAMKAGAYDFIEKPFSSDFLTTVVQRALEKRQLTLEVQELRRKLDDRRGIERVLIGTSAVMEKLRRFILTLSDPCPDVLIVGETGTGKELVARCLHQYSRLREGYFVAVNCGAIPDALFESEVFGHEPGAFTGAQKRRIGKMEHAKDGTLYLDEVESLPLSMQVKLLRAVQQRQIERLGSNDLVEVAVRIVASTKTDLQKLVEERAFRSDLYYRLDVVTLEVPPLRERREDIPLLFEHFLLEGAARYARDAPVVSGPFLNELMAHSWPGNVRELKNVADRFVLGVLGKSLGSGEGKGASEALVDQVDNFERSVIVDRLRRSAGNVGVAADALGTPKKTLYDKLRKYGIPPESFR
jgi:two-component system, NtrC family, C4-dicarboxylate transport response regulator DctD